MGKLKTLKDGIEKAIHEARIADNIASMAEEIKGGRSTASPQTLERPEANFLTDDVKRAIESAYDTGRYTFGVRAMTKRPNGEPVIVKVGDDLEHSYAAYDDVEPEELGGTSSVGIKVDFGEVEDADAFGDLVRRVARDYAEPDDQIVIISGRHNLDDVNNDLGETLISGAQVDYVLGKAGDLDFFDHSARPSGADIQPQDGFSSLNSLSATAIPAIGSVLLAQPNDASASAMDFASRRESKRSYWQQHRQDLADLFHMGADNAFAALDKPLQGYLALTSLAGNLAAGNGWGNAVQQAAQVARQPSDATTYTLGGTTTDALAPYVPAPVAAAAGTAVNAGIQLVSPF